MARACPDRDGPRSRLGCLGRLRTRSCLFKMVDGAGLRSKQANYSRPLSYGSNDGTSNNQSNINNIRLDRTFLTSRHLIACLMGLSCIALLFVVSLEKTSGEMEACDEITCMANSPPTPRGVIPADPRVLEPDELRKLKDALEQEKALEREVRTVHCIRLLSFLKFHRMFIQKVPAPRSHSYDFTS
jgi:hypothetical protein